MLPEHAKVASIQGKSQVVGEFLDWLRSVKGITLAIRHRHDSGCYCDCRRSGLSSADCPFCCSGGLACGLVEGALEPKNVPSEKLLAEFFEIDLDRLYVESRLAMEEGS